MDVDTWPTGHMSVFYARLSKIAALQLLIWLFGRYFTMGLELWFVSIGTASVGDAQSLMPKSQNVVCKRAILPAASTRRCWPLVQAERDLRSAPEIGAGDPFDRPHRVRGQRGDSDPVPGSPARAKRISSESECEPVFFMTAARWFSTVRWLMPRSAAMFLLG